MNIDIRLLTLEERVTLALLFHQIDELEDLCKPSMAEALMDPVKVHRIHELLSDDRVPVVSSELSEEQHQALLTGTKPDQPQQPIVLGYAGVLGEEMGERLTELFNKGSLDRDGLNNKRPVIHFILTVAPEDREDLRRIHAEWLKTRVSIPLESPWGEFWISPEMTPVDSDSGKQHFIAVRATTSQPLRELAPALDRRNASTLQGRYLAEEGRNRWRDVLDRLVKDKPELSFVHFMLYHFLQPIHVQEIHKAQLNGKALGMEYEGVRYRIVGITPHGTLMATTHLNQALLYEKTFVFLDVVRRATWLELEDEDT